MTHTDLSAEEPSERAATGPQFELSLEAEVKALGGTSMVAKGRMRAPSGSMLESAVAVFFLLVTGVALAVAAVIVLAATSIAGWLVGVIAVAVLGAVGAIATVLVVRKGSPKG